MTTDFTTSRLQLISRWKGFPTVSIILARMRVLIGVLYVYYVPAFGSLFLARIDVASATSVMSKTET
jgi:hypothetical protein